jgi:hypothetical protein
MPTFSGWVCALYNRLVPATAERRQFSGEPDAGNPHVRFDEGRGRRRRPRLLYCPLWFTKIRSFWGKDRQISSIESGGD